MMRTALAGTRNPILIRLLRFFVDLCLLRAAPQDLPASREVFVLAFLANAAVGTALGVDLLEGPGAAVAASLFDAAFMLGLLWLVLYLRNRPARFAQTATALLGSGAVLSLVALPLQSLTGPDPQASGAAQLGAVLILALMIWIQVVIGHILRHALELPLAVGVILAIGYTLFSSILFEQLFLSSG